MIITVPQTIAVMARPFALFAADIASLVVAGQITNT